MLNVILLKSDDAIVEGETPSSLFVTPPRQRRTFWMLVEEDAAELASTQPTERMLASL